MTERDRLGLRGLLPPRVISFEQQYDRFSKLAVLCLALVACMKVNIRLFIVTKGDYAQFIQKKFLVLYLSLPLFLASNLDRTWF